MLKEGLDVYLPLVDDDAIDAVIRRPDGTFTTLQIKARSKKVVPGDGALFAAIRHELRENYWFVFYSERMDMTWLKKWAPFALIPGGVVLYIPALVPVAVAVHQAHHLIHGGAAVRYLG